jgi:putative ABC transport system substrate-binding protein
VEAFGSGLRELGYVEGQNVILEYRAAEGDTGRVAALAVELARLPVDVLVTAGARAIAAAKQATSTTPIVIAEATDPVELGFVASLARPGGNVTGLSHAGGQLGGKRLDLLTQTAPGASRVAVLWDSAPGPGLQWTGMQGPAQALGVQLLSLEVPVQAAVAPILEAVTRESVDALLVIHSGHILGQLAPVLAFAAARRLPAIYSFREYVEAGGLMAYGPNIPAMFRRAAYYVDRILKGAHPSDLPVEQPREFDFVINLQTAQALGLTIPQHVLLQATEIIQ